MPLLVFLVLLIVADFVVLFTLGAQLGLLVTLLWIFISAAFGIHLIRRESLTTLQRARARFSRGELPSDELLHGAAFFLAGILLIAPGFLTDMLGLLCLVPGSDRLLRRWRSRRSRPDGVYRASPGAGADQTHATGARSGDKRGRDAEPLEGEFVEKPHDETRKS